MQTHLNNSLHFSAGRRYSYCKHTFNASLPRRNMVKTPAMGVALTSPASFLGARRSKCVVQAQEPGVGSYRNTCHHDPSCTQFEGCREKHMLALNSQAVLGS